mmetsp:Transcript_31465/g.70719  ORF Transcript_31465/g.70719 Transcript_31465/m.70719 type:complete len:221 (+) Transcript_31465:1321-1983(+)
MAATAAAPTAAVGLVVNGFVVGQGLEHPGELGREAGGEHAVCLVEHQEGEPPQRRGLRGLEVVQQAARGGHDHVRARRHLEGLLGQVHPADHGAHVDVERRPERGDLLRDLDAQLPRGRQDEGEHSVRILRELLQDGEGEGRGLARARLGEPHHVAPHQGRGHARPLYRGGAAHAQGLQGLDQPRAHPQLREGLGEGQLANVVLEIEGPLFTLAVAVLLF